MAHIISMKKNIKMNTIAENKRRVHEMEIKHDVTVSRCTNIFVLPFYVKLSFFIPVTKGVYYKISKTYIVIT